MVIYARAWRTGSCLRIRKGPFALPILAKTLMKSVADTFIFQVQVLPVNKAVQYAKNTAYCQNRPFLTSEYHSRAFCTAAPSLSCTSQHQLLCLLWGSWISLWVAWSLEFSLWAFGAKPPQSSSPHRTRVGSERGIYLPAQILRRRHKWSSVLLWWQQEPNSYCSKAHRSGYVQFTSLSYSELECQVHFSQQLKNLS